MQKLQELYLHGETRLILENIWSQHLNSKFNFYTKLRVANDEMLYLLGGFKSLLNFQNYSNIAINVNLDTLLKMNLEVIVPFTESSKMIFGLNNFEHKLMPHFNLIINEI